MGGATAYLGVDDVNAELARLVELGARVIEPPQEVGEGIVTASIADPFGNALGLIQNPHFAPR